MVRFATLLAAALLAPAAALADITLSNSSPVVFETVRVIVPGMSVGRFFDERQTRITMANNKITVILRDSGIDWSPNPPSGPIDIAIGQFPRGDYQVEVLADYPTGGAAAPLGSASFTVSRSLWPPAPPVNYSDLWWNDSESGWGLNVIQHGGRVFATWFVYGADGKPTWYVMPDGIWGSTTDYSGNVYRTTGPAFPGSFDPARVSATQVGTAKFSFTGIDHAFVDMTFDRGRAQKQLAPQSF